MAHKEIINDLQKKFSTWNPMKDDFTNSNFNQYSSGPGANLDLSLQTAQQQIKEHKKQGKPQQQRQAPQSGGDTGTGPPAPYLVFKQLPPGMTKNVIHNMCARHGRVSAVRDSTKNDYVFVDLATVADMEAIYRALEKNTYGFKILVGKQMNKRTNDHQLGPTTAEEQNSLPAVSANGGTADLQSRTYRTSANQLPRPKFDNKPFVSRKDYEEKDSLLQRSDPQRQYLFDDDAHALERAGLHNDSKVLENSKYNYRTGRAYINMPDKTKAFIKEKSTQSIGQYNAAHQLYQYHGDNGTAKKPLNVGKCAQCQCLCDSVCARCQTYFCGLECQRKAWLKHREVCGKPKSVHAAATSAAPEKPESTEAQAAKTTKSTAAQSSVNLNHSSSSFSSSSSSVTADVPATKAPISQQKNIPHSGNLVLITSISKTNVVFIRSKTYEDNLSFFKTVNDLQAAASKLQRLQQPPICGQIVIVKFEEQYNRAMVLGFNQLKRIKLIYVDYGNLDERKFADLYAAPEEFVKLERFAMPLILKDVPCCYMTEQIRKFMYSYLEGIDMVIKYNEKDDFIAEKGVYQAELIDEATNQNFNKMIATLCKPKEPINFSEVYFADYIKQKLLPAGDNIELMVMDNSLLCTGCISCTTKEWAVEIEKFQADLQLYGESLGEKVYTPRIGELCIAKYSLDGKWYRGRCLEIVGDGFPSIIFFDYGNIALVDINDIRLYPAQFTFPIYTTDCEIKGLPEKCEADLVTALEKMIPHGSIINCDNVTIYEEDNFHAITLNNVIKQLQDDGLLKNI